VPVAGPGRWSACWGCSWPTSGCGGCSPRCATTTPASSTWSGTARPGAPSWRAALPRRRSPVSWRATAASTVPRPALSVTAGPPTSCWWCGSTSAPTWPPCGDASRPRGWPASGRHWRCPTCMPASTCGRPAPRGRSAAPPEPGARLTLGMRHGRRAPGGAPGRLALGLTLLLAAGSLLVLGPTGARAATGTAAPPADLVVAGPAGSVVITRHPYRLQVLDTAGRPGCRRSPTPGPSRRRTRAHGRRRWDPRTARRPRWWRRWS